MVTKTLEPNASAGGLHGGPRRQVLGSDCCFVTLPEVLRLVEEEGTKERWHACSASTQGLCGPAYFREPCMSFAHRDHTRSVPRAGVETIRHHMLLVLEQSC